MNVEIVLFRLNGFGKGGKLVRRDEVPEVNATGRETRIGYDTAICVEVYEPRVIEVFYKSNLGLVAVRIVEQVNTIDGVYGEQNIGVYHGVRFYGF